MSTTRPLVVCALEAETGGRLNGYDVVYTGVGKINAAHALTRAMAACRPARVINIGTAGSAVFPARSVVACTSFVQRDMDVSPLGIDRFVTPYSEHGAVLAHGNPVSGLPLACCGSGDSFDTSHDPAHPWQVVDMEAYALALICAREGVPFTCIKYISDGADGMAAADWPAALADAAVQLKTVLATLIR